MILDTKELSESINNQLVELNSEIHDDHLKATAYFVDYDKEFEGMVANIIFVVEGETVDGDLEKLDEYCTKANDKLSRFVVFVNCIYRTISEYESDFKTPAWENIICEVVDG